MDCWISDQVIRDKNQKAVNCGLGTFLGDLHYKQKRNLAEKYKPKLKKMKSSLTLKALEHKLWMGAHIWSSYQYNRHIYGASPKKNGDFAWVMHMHSSVRDNTGRMAVVVPHGVLFRGRTEAKIRELLIKNGSLECVIWLAENLFYGTSTSACVLVLRKGKKALKSKKILFINADKIYTKGRTQNTMTEAQADEIYDIYKRQHENPNEIEGVSCWVSISEIKENGFSLNIARYVQKPLEEEAITIEGALEDFKQKFADLEQAEGELEVLLAKESFKL